ncbi:PRC-barrel domain-containing protein [Pseudoroseicyclus aestuarii]|uniref:PRC-barrel domain protein n=1 Tax=Pseudoroseicyclus aestuarii TaxID=1795041 RepID=A0A318TCF3_9RHOB|nr:PRC-barrel domain-containing protein [Pseudoroseicyclus aestuarii]PYE85988.1 PRC-barrel domain protein [Pseudoroseicyclus aestuarii]
MHKLLTGTAMALTLASTSAYAQDTETETTDTETVQVETVSPDEAETTAPAGTEMDGDAATMGDGDMEATGDEAAVPTPDSVMREQSQNELRIDWITDATVMSPDGETIGDINDVIYDGETGQLTAAIVSVGGFLGIGSKQIAVDWADLQVDYDANEVTASLSREEAEAAPEYVFREQEAMPAPAGDMGTGMDTTGMDTTGTAGTTGTADPALAPTADPATGSADTTMDEEPAQPAGN